MRVTATSSQPATGLQLKRQLVSRSVTTGRIHKLQCVRDAWSALVSLLSFNINSEQELETSWTMRTTKWMVILQYDPLLNNMSKPCFVLRQGKDMRFWTCCSVVFVLYWWLEDNMSSAHERWGLVEILLFQVLVIMQLHWEQGQVEAGSWCRRRGSRGRRDRLYVVDDERKEIFERRRNFGGWEWPIGRIPLVRSGKLNALDSPLSRFPSSLTSGIIKGCRCASNY